MVQVGHNGHANEIYRISFDGSIIDEKVCGHRRQVRGRSGIFKEERATQPPALKEASDLCLAALEQVAEPEAPSENLEVAVLDRTRTVEIPSAFAGRF